MNPFIFRPSNQCPYCGALLVLVTTEYTAQMLLSDGTADGVKLNKYSKFLFCTGCKSGFDVIEDGLCNLPAKGSKDIFKLKSRQEIRIPNYSPFGKTTGGN